MSKRTLNVDEIMSRAQKKKKSSYDILDEGSRIVSDKNSKRYENKRAGAVTSVDQKLDSFSLPEVEAEKNSRDDSINTSVHRQVKNQEPTSDSPTKPIEKGQVLQIGDKKIEEFILAVARDSLSSREYKVLLCLMAETCFGTKSEVEFSLEKLGEASGIYKNHVSKVVKSLVERGAVIRIRSENGQSNRYGLNLSFYSPRP